MKISVPFDSITNSGFRFRFSTHQNQQIWYPSDIQHIVNIFSPLIRSVPCKLRRLTEFICKHARLLECELAILGNAPYRKRYS